MITLFLFPKVGNQCLRIVRFCKPELIESSRIRMVLTRLNYAVISVILISLIRSWT